MQHSETCPACGAQTPPSAVATTHRYLASSPGCWARYGEVLAREYQDPSLMHIHGLTVDAYAAQHPGTKSAQTIQSINAHLVSLAAHLNHQTPLEQLARVRKCVVAMPEALVWLDPPPVTAYDITINDVWRASTENAHVGAVRQWAQQVFEAWRAHHAQVEHLYERAWQAR